MNLPDYLLKLAKESEDKRLWVNSLPSIIEKTAKEWNLKLGAPFLDNVSCSYVVPCLVEDRFNAILKIGLSHEEALHEIDGLILLNGNPTVKILKFDRTANTMLLERCYPGSHLNSLSEIDQDEILCKALRVIWSTPYSDGLFRPLSSMVALWNSETLNNLGDFSNPELAIAGCKLKEELVSNTEDQVLLATDLHAGNILKAQRNDWLVIDIKPHFGDRTYDLTQHILNCLNRFKQDPIGLINRLSKFARVDEDRLMKWMQARLLTENKGRNQDLGKRLLELEL